MTKTGKRTKEFEDFFTPDDLAVELMKHYLPLLDKSKVNRILEPTAGTGQLLWPLLATDYKIHATCLDIQSDYISLLAATAESLGYAVESVSPYEVIVKNYK